MADLKTTYQDDVLDTSVNEKRKYNMIQNADGTVSFEDVTTYSQIGDSFGAADINATNEKVNEVNSNLTNESDEQFVFGVKDGVRGFYTNPSRADDCFIPFKSMDVYYISSDGLPNPNPLKYTFTKNSQEGYVLLYGARTLYGSPVIFTVTNNKCNYEILDTYNSTTYEGHGILLKLTDIKKDGFIQIQTNWEVGGIFFVIY